MEAVSCAVNSAVFGLIADLVFQLATVQSFESLWDIFASGYRRFRKPKGNFRQEFEEDEDYLPTLRVNPKLLSFGYGGLNFDRRVSRNECICKHNEKVDTDEDAHIVVVPDWRLQKVQSPIELSHRNSKQIDHFDPLEFLGHWDNDGEATFTNNGRTATLRFSNRELPILRGGPLHEDSFVFEQLHFHWSEDDHSGCEHIFEGRAYSMEAHLVHYNKNYKSFNEAADKHDGLAVVAFFLQATDDAENPCFKKLSDAVKRIVKIDSTTSVPPDCLTWFENEAHCKGYYTYQGSLTTEPYNESVTWIIYPTPIHISKCGVNQFRNMKSTPCEQHTIRKNVRPVQEAPNGKLDVIYVRSHKNSL